MFARGYLDDRYFGALLHLTALLYGVAPLMLVLLLLVGGFGLLTFVGLICRTFKNCSCCFYLRLRVAIVKEKVTQIRAIIAAN